MSNNTSFTALVARRDFLNDWLADYTTKLSTGTALTEIEQCEYDYLLGKLRELNAEAYQAMLNKLAATRRKFFKSFPHV